MINKENFWKKTKQIEKETVPPLTDTMVSDAEDYFGYKLPKSYIELLKTRNGGQTLKKYCPLPNDAPSENNYIEIDSFFGIHEDDIYKSIYFTEYYIDEWEYPDIGIVICDTITAGHELIFLDYSECEKNEEPKVSYINQEFDYETIVLAESFEEFIEMLKTEEEL